MTLNLMNIDLMLKLTSFEKIEQNIFDVKIKKYIVISKLNKKSSKFVHF